VHVSRTCFGTRLLFVALTVTTGSCAGGGPSAQAFVENGDRYAREQRYAEAVIEYRNALAQDENSGRTRFKLAEALVAAGDREAASAQYARAADLLPDDSEVQLKTATMQFVVGELADARSRVRKVLAREPRNLDAQILLANATAGLRDFDSALTEIQAAIDLDPLSAPAYTSLALIRMEQGDEEAALVAFERAVEVAPGSVKARLALANYQWSAGAVTRAEASLQAAFQLDPRHPVVNRALALLYATTGRVAQAEPYLKAYAMTENSASAQFELVDFYLSNKRYAAARTLLDPLTRQRGARPLALTRLAILDYAEGNRAKAHATLDTVLQSWPTDATARVFKARFLLAEGKPLEALEHAKAAVTADPRDIRAVYLLGLAQVGSGDTSAAVTSFNNVLRMNPRAAAAQVQLSNLRLARGEVGPALEFAQGAYGVAPNSPDTRLALAKGLLGTREMARADSEIAALLRDYPDLSDAHALKGTLSLMRNDPTSARQAYERALQLGGHSQAALTGLTLLDMRAGALTEARKRLDAEMTAGPGRVPILLLAAQVSFASGDLPNAERVLRQVIELDTRGAEAYAMLGEVFAAQKRTVEAQRGFDEAVARTPGNVSARTMSAILVHESGDLSGAKKRYAEILDIEPKAVVAANNLAWIYADEGQNLDAAVQLAERAAEVAPQRADVRDTLGWVFYRKNLPQFAIRHFAEAVRLNPDNATFYYHLGLAYSSGGDALRARDALQGALKIDPNMPEAKAALSKLPRS